MHVSELQSRIQKEVKYRLNYRNLIQLCKLLKLSCEGRKGSLQDRIIDYSRTSNYDNLSFIIREIDGMMRDIPSRNYQNDIPSKNEYNCDVLDQAVLQSALISLDNEISHNLRTNLVVANFTQYNDVKTAVYTKVIPGINERTNVVRIPNNLSYLTISKSPFYACSTCLHPLSLMIPATFPHIAQHSRVNSRMTLTFYISPNVSEILNKYRVNISNNKFHYKWQVLLRFIAIDPSEELPQLNSQQPQFLPPYLNVTMNQNETVQLGDILPSNCKPKEGLRHPKPVNITDKLSDRHKTSQGTRQNVQMTWWQTPDVFRYYYVGVYLERKYTVKEMMMIFTRPSPSNYISEEETLRMIRSKLKTSQSSHLNNQDDDDLVVSSVLPVSLLCPYGRSRIEVAVRSIHCEHLQCFDAELYLAINDRRSKWMCTVCETKATPSDLLVDRFFMKILDKFKNDEDVNEVNVLADGTFIPIRHRDKSNGRANVPDISAKISSVQPTTNPIVNNTHNTTVSSAEEQPTIILDSDDEDSSSKTLPEPMEVVQPVINIPDQPITETMTSTPIEVQPIVIPTSPRPIISTNTTNIFNPSHNNKCVLFNDKVTLSNTIEPNIFLKNPINNKPVNSTNSNIFNKSNDTQKSSNTLMTNASNMETSPFITKSKPLINIDNNQAIPTNPNAILLAPEINNLMKPSNSNNNVSSDTLKKPTTDNKLNSNSMVNDQIISSKISADSTMWSGENHFAATSRSSDYNGDIKKIEKTPSTIDINKPKSKVCTIDLTLSDDEDQNTSTQTTKQPKIPNQKPKAFTSNLHMSKDWVSVTKNGIVNCSNRNSITSNINIPRPHGVMGGGDRQANRSINLNHMKVGVPNRIPSRNNSNVNNPRNKTPRDKASIDLTNDDEPPIKRKH